MDLQKIKEARETLEKLRYQLDGIVYGSPNPQMGQAGAYLDHIADSLDNMIQFAETQIDEICPRCGVNMQATHAPWCQSGDGMPIPDESMAMMYALQVTKNAFARLVDVSFSDGELLWALAELARTQGDALAEGASVSSVPF